MVLQNGTKRVALFLDIDREVPSAKNHFTLMFSMLVFANSGRYAKADQANVKNMIIRRYRS